MEEGIGKGMRERDRENCWCAVRLGDVAGGLIEEGGLVESRRLGVRGKAERWLRLRAVGDG